MSNQKETSVWKSLLLFLSPLGYRLSRNQRYRGQIVSGGNITNAWADCGVFGDGGSDLIGYRIIEVTPDMVGKKMALFVAIETKIHGGARSKEQKNFIERVQQDGGEAFFCVGIDDYKKRFDKAD